MQIESKKKVKTSIEEQIKVEEERIKQESNHLKMLKKKLNKENRKKGIREFMKKERYLKVFLNKRLSLQKMNITN